MIVDLSDGESERNLVGGKGAELIRLKQAGFNVPSAFIIATDSFMKMDVQLEKSILLAFDRLNSAEVAVRSSAIAEDGDKASWAGQFETFLNVKKKDLIKKVKACWDSAHSERAEAYAQSHDTAGFELKVAVVVQAMVDAKVAGVAFSVNPVNNDPNQMVIEATPGLGEALVSGEVTPDTYVLDKVSGGLVDAHLSSDCLSQEQQKELFETISKVEQHYKYPVDIEWAIDTELWLLQSRPVTTMKANNGQ